MGHEAGYESYITVNIQWFIIRTSYFMLSANASMPFSVTL